MWSIFFSKTIVKTKDLGIVGTDLLFEYYMKIYFIVNV